MELPPLPGEAPEPSEPAGPEPAEPAASPLDDADVRALVRRLSRANTKGGVTIERAAIMAEGAQLDTVIEWIVAHDGQPEERPAPKSSGRGLHAARMSAATSVDRPPLRYVLPAAALAEPTS